MLKTAIHHILASMRLLRAGRHIAQLGGSTTLGDCAAALGQIAHPRNLVRGDAIAEYEQAFARTIGVRYAYSFSAGRVGLYGILRALGVRADDEVLLQVPTHVVVANAVRYVGARPVYVDCHPENYTMDLEQAQRRITPRTKVLLVQHTFGIPTDLDSACTLARRRGLSLVEDCVHALGSTYDGRPVGSFGRAAFFSTEETKTISSTMGGMVVTDDPELAARIDAFQATCLWPSAWLSLQYVAKFVINYFFTEPYVYSFTRALHHLLGRRNPLPPATTRPEQLGIRPMNYAQRLSNAQAALALRQLQRLQQNVAHRRTVAAAYRSSLSRRGFIVPQAPPKADTAYVRYPIWVENRRAAAETIGSHAVPGTWFTEVLQEAESAERMGYSPGSCSRAEEAIQHLLNLPTHPRVKLRDVEAITAALAAPLPRSPREAKWHAFAGKRQRA
jgi:dTDP-4-amino-4,6-dideoxygalactose transaminase